MKAKVLAFLYPIIQDILSNMVKSFYEKIFELIEKAEEDINKGEKKEFVEKEMKKFVKENVEVSWIEEIIVNHFVSNFIDYVIDLYNNKLGKEWLKIVKESENSINKFIDKLK